MPQAIGFVLAGGGFAGGAAALGYTAAAGIGSVIAYQAITLAVLTVVNRKLADRKKLPDNGATPREVTVRATDAYESFVYGRAMIGGLTVYNNTITVSASAPNNTMVHVVKWASHPVNCLQLFRLDDRTLDPSVDSVQWNPVTYVGSGLVQTGAFRGYNPDGSQSTAESPTRMRWYDGKQTSADFFLNLYSADWPLTAIGRDRTYGVMEIKQISDGGVTDQVYQRGFPSNIQAYIHGKSVYDQRRSSLNGDPTFLNTSSFWSTGDSSNALSYPPTSWTIIEGVGGTTDRALQAKVESRAGNWAQLAASEPMRCNPSSLYRWHMRARRPIGLGRVYRAGMAFWTEEGLLINDGASTYHYFMVDQDISSLWTDFHFTAGSGGTKAVPTSGRWVRPFILGVNSQVGSPSSGTILQIQELRMWNEWGSRHLIDVASTWEYSVNPANCAADFLRNEQFGFGRESRLPVNASRYARNSDPCWRRRDTMTSGLYWRAGGQGGAAYESGNNTALTNAGMCSLTSITGAPIGTRVIVMPTSDTSLMPGGFGGYAASEIFPVDHEGNYVVSFHGRSDGGPRTCFAGLYWLTDSYTVPSGNPGIAVLPAALTTNWSNYVALIGSGTGNVIPASAHNACILVSAPNSQGANGATTFWFQEFQIHPGTQIRKYVEPWEQIMWASVCSAASYCSEQVQTPSGTQVRFECNGQGHTGRSYRENLKDILGSGNLRVTYGQSGWMIFGGWQEPSITLNQADLIGPLEVRGAAETRDRYNTVRGTFFDRHQDGKQVPSATVTAAEYRARDNSMQLFEDIDLSFTDDWFGAQRVQFGLLEQGDNQMIVRAPVGYAGLGLQAGRHVALRAQPMSWVPKNFLMTELTYDVRRGVMAVLREDFATSYTDPTSAEYVPHSGGSVTSYAPHVPQVSSVVLAYLGRDGVRLTWVNPANRSFEWIDVHRRVGTTNAFSGSALWKTTRNAELADPSPFSATAAVTAYYWFQTRDFAGNISSVYPGLASSFYPGPSAGSPPAVPQVSSVTILSRPDAVSLRWINTSDNRLFEWVDVYRRATTNAFSGSSLVHSTRGDEHLDQLGIGDNFYTHYYWLVTRDHLGNQSAPYPGLTSSFSATPVVPVAKDPEYVFLEEFNYQTLEQFEAAWMKVDAPYAAGITFPESGILGGKVLRASSAEAWYTSRIRIPYDPEALYRMSARARMTTSGDPRHRYFGLTGYRANGINPIDVDSTEGAGNQHYFVVSGHIPTSLDIWDEHIGHVSGHMPWPRSGSVYQNITKDPKQAARMHDLTRYVSPLFVLNYDNGTTAAQEIDYIKVEKVPRTGLVYDPYVKNGSNWVGGHAYNNTTSYDFINGYTPNSLAGYTKESVSGKYGVANFTVRSYFTGDFYYAFYEKLRTNFHAEFAEVGCMTFSMTADVYVSSSIATSYGVVPTIFAVTKNGSLAAQGLSLLGTYIVTSKWQGIVERVTFSNSAINTTSYPGPYYMVPGIALNNRDAYGSYALASMRVYQT
jgi:hypothetical protein